MTLGGMMKSYRVYLLLLIAVIAVGVLAITYLLVRGYFVDQAKVMRDLESKGYYNIQVVDATRMRFLGGVCGRDAAAEFDIRANLVKDDPATTQTLAVCVRWPGNTFLVGWMDP
jgi:hypothetical protein